MNWVHFEDERRQKWLVSEEGLWLLCQQAVYAQMMYQRMRVVADESPWFWHGAPVRNVEFDFTDFHPTKIKLAQEIYAKLTTDSLRQAGAVFEHLVQMKDELDLLTRRVNGKKSEVARDNADCLQRNVDFFGGLAHGAKMIRDASVTILMTGASVLSGGAAVAVLGAGSALKGVGTYQDTVNLTMDRRVGAALLSAGGAFGVGLIPGGKGAERVALMSISAIANGATTFGTGLAQGDGVRKSLISAVMSSGLSAIPLNAKLKDMAVPIDVELVAPTILKSLLPKGIKASASVVGAVALGSVASAESDVVTSGVADAAAKRAARKAVGKNPAASATPTTSSIAEVPVSQQHLVGVPTRLDEPVSSRDYVLRTAMCPAG